MFVFKKIISTLIMPLPLLLIIGFLGLSLLFYKKYRAGKTFVSISLIGLFLISFQPITTSLLKPIEQQYPIFIAPEENVDYVVVLGGGHIEDYDFPISSRISRNSLMRLVEGIRIQRMYPNSKLIISGYKAGTSTSGAVVMADVAVSLGVDKIDIILLETPKNTEEEANQTVEFVKDKHIVLVTSANHMPRAMAEFQNVGLSPTPAPTNFIASSSINQAWDRIIPQSKYLNQTEIYWRELLSSWWNTLTTDNDDKAKDEDKKEESESESESEKLE